MLKRLETGGRGVQSIAAEGGHVWALCLKGVCVYDGTTIAAFVMFDVFSL